jgi:hypothetical protein
VGPVAWDEDGEWRGGGGWGRSDRRRLLRGSLGVVLTSRDPFRFGRGWRGGWGAVSGVQSEEVEPGRSGE